MHLCPTETWTLMLEPVEGWEPAWRTPALIACVVGGVAISAALFLLLVYRQRHAALLAALLPGRALRSRLASGAPDAHGESVRYQQYQPTALHARPLLCVHTGPELPYSRYVLRPFHSVGAAAPSQCP